MTIHLAFVCSKLDASDGWLAGGEKFSASFLFELILDLEQAEWRNGSHREGSLIIGQFNK